MNSDWPLKGYSYMGDQEHKEQLRSGYVESGTSAACQGRTVITLPRDLDDDDCMAWHDRVRDTNMRYIQVTECSQVIPVVKTVDECRSRRFKLRVCPDRLLSNHAISHIPVVLRRFLGRGLLSP